MSAPEVEADAAAQAGPDRVRTSSPHLETSNNAIEPEQNGPPIGRRGSTAIKQEGDEQQNGVNPTRTSLRPNPEPSIKRRESQQAMERPEIIERPSSKKRKRAVSPPWQFPTAEQTTLKSADGRRISARFSTNAATPVVSENESRARSSSLSAPPRSSRAPSPPWKKFEAEGPSSVMVDGQRKSGRVNRELGEEGKPKRVSPRSKKMADPVQSHVNGKGTSSEKGHVRKVSGATTKKEGKQPKRSGSPVDPHAKIAELKAKLAKLQPTRSFGHEDEPPSSNKRKRNRERRSSQLDGTSSPPTNRKTPRASKAPQSPESASKPVRKFRLHFNSGRHNIPPPHPNAKLPSPIRPPGLSLHQMLDECDLREMQQPYMENERGPPDLAWFKQRAVRQAEEEAAMRSKILKAAEPGGLLSREWCSVYEDADPQPEPPTVYTHVDYLMNHIQNFRQLQVKENKDHRFLAKKIANEALEYWKKKRGPTEEDIQAEQDRIFKLIYKQVVVDVKAKWELVAQHVHGKRLQAWEADQEVKRQQRLQEKLAKSKTMVARQRGALDEDAVGDFDESQLDASDEGEREEDEESSSEENMSDSESGDDAGDEEDAGEMDEAAFEAYRAARLKEKADEQNDIEHDADEDADVSMADVEAPTGDSAPQPEATPLPPKPDATLADLFAEEGQDDESEEDFQPADSESQVGDDEDEEDEDDDDNEEDEQPQIARDLPSYLSRRSSVAADTDNAVDLSEDDSINMDSDDHDDDEDTTNDTGNDTNAASKEQSDADDEEAQDSSDEEGQAAGAGLLGFYSKKDQKANFRSSLPTPTTSAEGDIGDVDVQGAGGPTADTAAGAGMDDEDDKSDQDDTLKLSSVQKAQPPLQVDESAQESFEASPQPVEATSPSHFHDPAEEEVVAKQSEADDDEGLVKNLVPQPTLLRGTLRSYQHAGLDWLASLYRNGTNGILADEMGLGKTIQTIALLAHLAEEYGCWETHLVIVPTSVVLNWVTEFQKFLPGFRVLAYYGTSEERQAKRKGWVNDPHLDDKTKRGYNVVVTSYNVAMQDISALRGVPWHYLVLDEAHNIRNFNSQRWQVLIRLKTQARLLLTGTPLQNSLTELWSLLTFLTAGDDDPAHGDLEEFLSHWRDPVREIFDAGVQTLSSEAQKVVDQLHISLRPFLLRRLKSEVEKDLPKKTESVVVCKLSKRQRQLYQEYMGLAEVKKSLAQGNAVSAGKVLLSLRRVCNHPDLFDPRGVETSWGMERSVVEEFGVKGAVFKRLLGSVQEVPAMLIVVGHEGKGKYAVKRAKQLSASEKLAAELSEAVKLVKQDAPSDPSTMEGCRALRRVRIRQNQLEKLRSTIRISDNNLVSTPIYGSDLQEVLTIKRDSTYRVKVRPPPVSQPYGAPTSRPPQPVVKSLRGWPQLGSYPLRFESEHPSDWLIARDSMLQNSTQTYNAIGEKLHDILTRFAFVTPAVTAPVLDYLIPTATQRNLRASPTYPFKDTDYAHESRIRLSINFPDSRLLVYDSGKLQRLTILLRDLQAKGSRSLIFTQMTGTLNILEQFLNIMNLPYLRLDGTTSAERRHLYAQEFNRPDSKYQVMILSSRAGGVGLNLTGASSVIFYDLDWNPQMDRQCMDRAHRIGQVRDVEVFKMVSEKTVEENILRRAEQKSLLDQTVIQEGHFTTDYEIGGEGKRDKDEPSGEGQEDVAAAIERFLGQDGNDKSTTQALESVEDREDVAAAQRAHKEEHQDEADFGAAVSSNQHSGRATPAVCLGLGVGGVDGVDGEGEEGRGGHLDGWMVGLWEWAVRDVVFVPPVVRKRDRGGRDGRKRRR